MSYVDVVHTVLSAIFCNNTVEECAMKSIYDDNMYFLLFTAYQVYQLPLPSINSSPDSILSSTSNIT